MTTRIILALALALLLGSAARAQSRADLERTHEQILRRLGLEPGRVPLKQARTLEGARPQVRVGRGLGAAIRELRTKPFLAGRPVYTPAERNTLAKLSVEHSYSPLVDPAIRIASDPRVRQRSQSIYFQLARGARRELGLGRDAGLGPLVVLEGGRADGLGASTLANGSFVLQKGTIDLADQVAAALEGAESPRAILDRLSAAARGRFTVEGSASRQTRKVADGFLAQVVGHEITHALKQHPAMGAAGDVSHSFLGASSRTYRAQELVADAGGIELGLRGGYSPVGMLAFYLYQAVAEGQNGGATGPGLGTHPSGYERYCSVYNYLGRRARAQRLVYDGTHPARAGDAYLDESQRTALRGLPTPGELREYMVLLPHGLRFIGGTLR